VLGDEKGWSGAYTPDLKGIKTISQKRYRQEVFRKTSTLREHISVLPFIVLKLKWEGNTCTIASAHRMKPLFVLPRAHLNTRMAESILDPANANEALNALEDMSKGSTLFRQTPFGVPRRRGHFPRLVAASPSGNVNSVIIRNVLRDHLFPFIRSINVTEKQYTLFLWDLHSTHADVEVVNLQEENNAGSAFMPGKATDRLQLQDQDEVHTFSAESKNDIAKWVAFLGAKGIKLSMEDFPMVVQHALKQSQTNRILAKGLQKIGLAQLTTGDKMEISPDPNAVLSKMEGAKPFAAYEIQFAAEEKKLEEGKLLEAEKCKDNADELAGEELLGVLDSDDDELGAGEGGIRTNSQRDQRNELRLAQQKQEAEDNEMWWKIASDNKDNRGSGTRHGVRQSRLRQKPRSVTIDARPDVFDFDKEALKMKVAALMEGEAAPKPSGRGKKLGNKNDVFSARDLLERRRRKHDATEAKKKKKKMKAAAARAAAREAKQTIKAQRREIKKLEREIKRLSKGNKAVNKRARTSVQKKVPEEDSVSEDASMVGLERVARRQPSKRQRKGPPPKYASTSEDTDESSEEEEHSEEEGSREEEESSWEKGASTQRKESGDASGSNEEDDADNSSSTDDDTVIGEAVAPAGFTLHTDAPGNASHRALKDRQVLYRYDALDVKGWLQAKVRDKAPNKSEKHAGFNVVLRYRLPELHGDVPSLLSKESYAKRWFLLDKADKAKPKPKPKPKPKSDRPLMIKKPKPKTAKRNKSKSSNSDEEQWQVLPRLTCTCGRGVLGGRSTRAHTAPHQRGCIFHVQGG